MPSVFATFMYGSMSDATGRKPVLLVALCGAFIHFLIVSMTVTFGMYIKFCILVYLCTFMVNLKRDKMKWCN